jgi:recombination protein RecT
MNINWEMVHSVANKCNLQEFLDKIDTFNNRELPAVQQFSSYMDKYEKKVLPALLQQTNTISPAKFVQIVTNEVKKNSKLLNAFAENPSSMFASILAGAEIGLVPSDLLGEFYLIPRTLKIDGKFKLSVTPLIGYKGLVKILLRSGDIQSIEAHVVYEGDLFDVQYGTNPKLNHEPKAINRTSDKISHVYCVAFFKSGRTQFHVLSRQEILNIKNMSKNNNDLYFNDQKNPNRWMEKKCCLIQLSKLLDKDYYGTKAIELDGKLEGGATLDLEGDEVKVIENKTQKPERFRNIYDTLNKL